MTDQTHQLYARTPIHTYGLGDLKKLEDELDEADKYMLLEEIRNPSELQLKPSGETKTGAYRYTSIGFQQVASSLAKGLSTLVPELWGLSDSRVDTYDMEKITAAVRVFNTVVENRFDLLSGFYLVVNRRARLIQGLVSPKYTRIENPTFLEMTQDVAMDSEFPVEFYHATLIGRRLTVQYRSKQPLTRYTDSEVRKVYIGYQYRNGEITGTSVRSFRLVLLPFGQVLWPVRGGKPLRTVHSGRNMDAKAEKTLRRTLLPGLDMAVRVVNNMLNLRKKPLNVPRDPESREEFMQEQASAFSGRSLAKWVGESIIERAVLHGHAGTDMPTNRDFDRRTHYDVLCAMLQVAQELDLERRDRVEQLAFNFIDGTFMLNQETSDDETGTISPARQGGATSTKS